MLCSRTKREEKPSPGKGGQARVHHCVCNGPRLFYGLFKYTLLNLLRFINDTIRNDFHQRFLKKYVR